MMEKELSKSEQLAAKTMFSAFKVLKTAGGQLPGRGVLSGVEKDIDLNEWDKEVYAKTGNIRWQSILHFYTINAIKAGLLRKKKGIWYLTPEGEKAIELGDLGLLEVANNGYKRWKEQNSDKKGAIEKIKETESDQYVQANIDEKRQDAINGLRQYVAAKNPYEFQDICAALLRAMGYYTPFIAPRGKDGGVDIIVYQDPLGTKVPRIKVQVKHRGETLANVKEVRELMGVLTKDDVGIFVSTGGFTNDAFDYCRTAHAHIELIDFERLVDLWQEFYPKMPDEDKQLLPLQAIYFLSSAD